MWHAFAEAIHEGKPFAASFREQLKMHHVSDATETSMRERRWVKVEYGDLAGDAPDGERLRWPQEAWQP